jgi:ribonuclease Z
MFKVCRSMGLRKVIAVEVDHCPQSYACLLLSENGDKIVYSGDTLPCQNLINYAANCKVLIHEATFEDGLEQDALFKKHTTTGQAIEVGRKVKAWRTILTHFSPRYQKIAEISQKHLDNKCLVAFDHMRIRLSHLEWAYHITELYSKLLSNDDIG